MTLTVEDGTGVAGANSYASVAFVDTYWSARITQEWSSSWSAADAASKESALLQATAFLDAEYGSHYRGSRQSYDNGLMWPRTDALDVHGNSLPDLPVELQRAAAELAARALSAQLAPDQGNAGTVKRVKQKVDVIETETEYDHPHDGQPAYGFVARMLEPLLDGSQSGASWHWR